MKINHAIEVANILRHNIVQGVRDADDKDGNWGTLASYFLYSIRVNMPK